MGKKQCLKQPCSTAALLRLGPGYSSYMFSSQNSSGESTWVRRWGPVIYSPVPKNSQKHFLKLLANIGLSCE